MKKRILAGFICISLLSTFLCGCGTFDFSLGGDEEKEKAIESGFNPDMTSFSTKDLDGNEVNQDIFKDYDVTMVNVWDTTCQACTEEMPALEKMYENLDSNVNLIGICTDGAEQTSTAQGIASKTGVTFQILQSTDTLNSQLEVNGMKIHPTTFFVDSQGNMIGDVQVGQPSHDPGDDGLIEAYSELINKALEAAK